MTTDSEQKKSERQRRRTAAEIRELARQAYQLKIGGATFDAIARTLGYSDPAGALRAYRSHIARTTDPDTVEFHRELELQRLEDMRQALYNQAIGDPGGNGRAPTAPDLDAIRTLLSIHDRKVRLLGLHREPTVDPTEELLRYAAERGLDPDAVLREADAVIANNRSRWTR